MPHRFRWLSCDDRDLPTGALITRTQTLALVLGLALVAPAIAETGKEDLKRYCTGDATTYCGGMDLGGEEMKACFTKHRKDLSENCRRAIDAYEAKGGK